MIGGQKATVLYVYCTTHCPKSMRVFCNMVRSVDGSVDENNSNDTEYSQLFFRTMLRMVLCSL